MKKRVLYSVIGAVSLLFAACGKEEITPSIDITPEYDYLLELTPNSIHADTVISEWYQKYEIAVLYKFEEKDFRWMWAEKLHYYYETLDITMKEDSIALETMVKYIDEYLIANREEEKLRATLPYKIFLTKEMHTGSDKTDDYNNCVYNGQDAILLGYLESETEPYDEVTVNTNLNSIFNRLVYNALDPKPTDFINSREQCSTVGNNQWVTMPVNKDIENEPEWDVYPSFVPTNEYGQVDNIPYGYYHLGNVLGYIYTYGSAPGKANMYLPDEATDYGDYYSFITNQSGSYIRERTQYYWRIAKRANILIKFCQEYQNEDLIAIQNANVPDDPVTMEDFAYEERY